MFRLLAAFVVVSAVTAQGDPQPGEPRMQDEELYRLDDAVGTQYTIFFSENDARRNNLTFNVSLFLTTHEKEEIKVQVIVPLITQVYPIQNVTVRRGQVTEVTLDQEIMAVGSGVSNKGIRIVASGNIIVYGINPQKFSSEGFLALPDHLLDSEYFAISMPVTIDTDSATQLGVVAVAEGITTIDVTLPQHPNLTVFYQGDRYGPGAEISVELRQYQVLQLQHHVREGIADLSGAHINCSQVCSAFSGNSRTSVDGGSRDLLVEHLQPVATWGKVFAVPATPERVDRPDVLKIVCQQDNTYVKIDDRDRIHCDRAGVIQTQISTDAAHLVSASKPIMCASVVMSQQGPTGYSADPAMTLVIPERQYAQTYTIATAEKSDTREYINFLTVVIRRDRADKIILDGENVNTDDFNLTWHDVPGTGSDSQAPLATTYFKITAGTHTITTLDADATFMCIVYGAGDRVSYAYMGGMRLAVINPRCVQTLQVRPGDGIDNDCDVKIDEELCEATDDDGDGQAEEDCRIENAVIALGDKTIRAGETTSMYWRVYAVQKEFDRLIMNKQQPGARMVEFAAGNGNLVLGGLFAEQGRYSLFVSPARKAGQLWAIDVTLNVERGSLVDTGNYSLSYFGHDGLEYSDKNILQVQPLRQRYEIIASDLQDGGDQRASSESSPPRNLYFSERKRYTIKFHSIGGQHVADLPYRISLDNRDVSRRFEVVGQRPAVSVGNVIGLQEVKTIYVLVWNNAPAQLDWDEKVLSAQNNAGRARVDAVLNVDAVRRPKMSCVAEEMPSDRTQTQIVCSITDAKDIDLPASWFIEEQDEPFDTFFSRRTYGDYSTRLERNGEGRVKSYLTGIKASQWPATGGIRTFTFSFTQDGFTLSQDIQVERRVRAPTTEAFIEKINNEIVMSIYIHNAEPDPTRYNWAVRSRGNLMFNMPINSRRQDYTSSRVEKMNNGTLKLTLKTIPMEFDRNIIFTTAYIEGGDTIWDSRHNFFIERAVKPGRVMGEMNTDQPNTIVIDAWVEEGAPVSNRYKWKIQLRDGSYRDVNPGESGNGWSTTAVRANRDGKPASTLTVTYPFIQPRAFTFNASSVTGSRTHWTASHVFAIRSNIHRSERPEIESRVERGNPPRLVATLIGGSPRGRDWYWTLPDGTLLRPGSSSGNHVASGVNVNGERRTYYLTFTDGLPLTRKSYRFTASSDIYWTVTAYYDVQAASTPATISARHEVVGGTVMIYMKVRGGSPPATESSWSFSHNGRSYRLTPGDSAGSHHTSFTPTRNNDGSLEYKLSINDLSILPNTYTFTTSSKHGSDTLWRKSFDYTLRPVQGPAATCGLMNDRRVKVGDEVQIRCTVTLNDHSANTMQLSYTNGYSTISQSSSSREFAYSQNSGEGFIESRLSFTLPRNGYDRLTSWTHKVIYPGGVLEVPIDIPVSDEPDPPAPRGKVVVGVEGNNMVLTCQLSTARPSFANLVWERKSLGPSGARHVIYIDQQVRSPFTESNRYQVENSISNSELATSNLKITNLQRADAAQYSCKWGDRTGGVFDVDVIGAILLVDGRPFNGPLTKFVEGNTYNMQFEFESTYMSDYTIDHNGVDSTGSYQKSQSSSSRYDSFAGENIPITTYRYTDTDFRAQPQVIKTNYKLEGDKKLIKQYILTKTSGEVIEPPRIIEITTDGQIHRANQTITLDRNSVITFGVKVDSSRCNSRIKILFGGVDETARRTFRRETRNMGSYCIITFTRTGYRPRNDHNKTIKIIWEGSTRTVILSENLIELRSPSTTTTRPPRPTTTRRPTTELPLTRCRRGNGGCDYECRVMNGREVCYCPPGMRLSSNGKSCVDIDECSQSNTCQSNERCMNTYGGYVCIKLCECDCCELNSGRGKRSIEDMEYSMAQPQTMNTEIFFPLTGAGVVSWLSVVTAVSVIALAVAFMNCCRRNGFTKLGA